MQNILRLQGVSKAFGGIVTSDCVSFEVQKGEIMGLIGPNGAGKTTILNLISGLYPCDSGSIYLGEQNITNLSAYKRARLGIARTFQQPRFMRRSSIRENLLIGADLGSTVSHLASFLGKNGPPFEKYLSELLQLAELDLQWDNDISSLPYGQRKLLEIVRALMTHPKVVLIDEPAAGLNDVELQRVNAMLEYMRTQDIAVILIEHKMDMIMSVCDRILVLNFGKVIGFGSPDEISKNVAVQEAYLGRDSNCVEDQ